MSDQFQRDQEVIALRQQIEQQCANQPAFRDALRAHADALDFELRRLPAGTAPYTAIDHLANQSWFREAAQTMGPDALENLLLPDIPDVPDLETVLCQRAQRADEEESPEKDEGVWYYPPKQFTTHLPPLSHTEVIVVFGRVLRSIDIRYEGHWQVIAEECEAANPQFKATVDFPSNKGTRRIQIDCHAFTTFGTDPSLYVSFSDNKGWNATNERIVGEAMQEIHQALTEILEPPTGLKLWVLRGGRWETGIYFDS